MDKYVSLAPAHVLAVNLDARDLQERYKRGEFPKAGWEVEVTEAARKNGQIFRTGLLQSFFAVSTCAFAAIAIAWGMGSISVALPLAWTKVFSVIGGFFAAWATLFELGGYAESWKGQNLHEIARPVIFKAMFLPGLAVATLGQL